jgi:hypothetical protein
MAEQENINDKIGIILKEWFTDRVQAMKDTLEVYDIRSGPNMLPNDIVVPPMNPTSEGISAELVLPDYYIFVDEGVKGIGNLRAGESAKRNTGRYSFKNEYISKGMVDNLKEWGARRGRSLNKKNQEEDKPKKVTRAIKATSATGVRSSAKGVKVDPYTVMAILTAKKIKRTGLRQTMFFTDNFKEEHLRELEKRIEDATGLAFELSMQIEDRAVRVRG